MRRQVGLVIGIALGAACSDPSLDVVITYQGGLTPRLDSVALSVVVLEDATGAPATCPQVEYGELPAAVLEGGRRAVTHIGDAPRLSGVPRLGPKLIVVEGRDAGGRRIAGGCTELGDITDDTVVAVTAMIAPRVRAIAQVDASPQQVFVVEPWPGGQPIDGLPVRAELRGGAGKVELTAPYPVTDHGLATLPELTLAGAGPQQTVIRVPWAEPVVVPGLRLWPEILDGNGEALAVDTTTRNGRDDPSWVVVSDPAWALLGLHVPIDEPEVVSIRYDAAAGGFVREPAIAAPGVRALVGWNGRIFSIVGDLGWVRLGAGGFDSIGGSAAGFGPATELVAIDGCGLEAPASLLALRASVDGDDRSQTWVAYDRPGVPSAAGTAMAFLASALNGRRDPATGAIDPRQVGQVAGQGCAGGKQVVAVRRPDLALVAYVADEPTPRALPIMSAFTTLGRTGVGLVGVAVTLTGPRVVSFAAIRIGTVDLFIGNDAVDTALAGVASSIVITALAPDGDADPQNDSRDVIAAIGAGGATRLQVSLQDRVGGMPAETWSVSGISGPIAGDAPRLRHEDVDGDGHDDLVVLTTATARVFRWTP